MRQKTVEAQFLHRRQALRWIVGGIGLASVGSVLAPAVASLLSPVYRHRRLPDWRAVGPIDEFAVGGMHKAVVNLDDDPRLRTVAARGVYVWRRQDGEVVVYSRACTDLGCPVRWDPGSEWFFCPCHGGIFDKEGRPVAGPPPRPLYRYHTRIRDGLLQVDVHSVPPMA